LRAEEGALLGERVEEGVRFPSVGER